MDEPTTVLIILVIACIFIIGLTIWVVAPLVRSLRTPVDTTPSVYWKMMDNYKIQERNLQRIEGKRHDTTEKYHGEI